MAYLNQFLYVLTHKWLVLRFGLVVGKIPIWRLIIHDWSKFTPTEFIHYARWIHGHYKGQPEKYKIFWARSWLHHLHCNPHHPEHWVLSWRGDPGFYNDLGVPLAPFVTVLPMPRTYVREWVADMMATGYKLNGHVDIAEFLNQAGPSWILHPVTVYRLNQLMRGLGYRLDGRHWTFRELTHAEREAELAREVRGK